MTAKIKVGKYMIYRMYNKKLKEEETLFFLPDSDLGRFVDRISTLQSYKLSGYVVMGVLYVDHEAYLNARLTNYCEEFIYLDNHESDVRDRLQNGLLEKDIAVETLSLIKDSKWTVLKQINMCFRRMVRNDYDIENELACALNDLYLQELNL